MSKRYKLKRRARYYVGFRNCSHCGNKRCTLNCYLPEPPRYYGNDGRDGETPTLRERKPDDVLCYECAPKLGYCYSCGDFFGGISSFEFLHPGICDNCEDERRSDMDDYPDEDSDYDLDAA